jgi:hypothetical protein
MRPENTRTLKNNSYKSKKSSRKSSKKNSKKNRKDDTNTTEEMMQLLDSDTEVYVPNKNNLVPFNGEVPNQPQPMQQNFGQMGPMNNNHLQMYSPGNYDPLMLQQIAPLQTAQAVQGSGMPANLLSPNNMVGNLSHLGRSNFTSNVDPMGGMMASPMNMGMAQSGMPNIPQPGMPNIPQPGMPGVPGVPGNVALSNLSMLGGGKRLI